jgi:dTDP-4-amino-4,6-dideoxygalactose transaminase
VIPFNRPFRVGTETGFIEEALGQGQISADGEFSRRCRRLLEQRLGADAVLLTTSCTSALEAAVLLRGDGSGEEVMMATLSFV